MVVRLRWFTGQKKAPASVASNAAYRAIHDEVQTRMGSATLSARNATGAEWVRGWNDKH